MYTVYASINYMLMPVQAIQYTTTQQKMLCSSALLQYVCKKMHYLINEIVDRLPLAVFTINS